ncbi:MAG: BCD family MFS transporter [Roseiflexaceae bacterium]
MPFRNILRLGLIHIAVALTLLPINSVLNRIMISELGIAASLVGLLIALPYLCSPLQVWIGTVSDRRPLLGYRRSPYIALGLLLCAGGSALTPTAAFLLADGLSPLGLLVGVVAFGAWGMGFNCATVSYLSLATDLAGHEHRARTIGVMWFMMILSMIIGGITLGRALDPYTHERLFQAFYTVCGLALALGFGALIGLERRGMEAGAEERRSFPEMARMIAANPQARLFFVYLIVLLVALLGQDLLLEPFAAQVFGVPVRRTTEYTSIWGLALLVALLLTSPLGRRIGNVRVAALGGALAGIGLLLIVLSGALVFQPLFIPALIVFGFGSGLSTASNLALMLDMTLPGQVGAFIGAWGMADAIARLCGTLLSGVVRDTVFHLTNLPAAGYLTVFTIEAAAVLVSLILLRRISTEHFQGRATPTPAELSALLGETQ